jgi:hypothetical protein
VEVGGADATVGYFDVDIGLFEGFGFVCLVFELAFDRVFIKAHPAFKFVVGGHGGVGGVDLEDANEGLEFGLLCYVMVLR